MFSRRGMKVVWKGMLEGGMGVWLRVVSGKGWKNKGVWGGYGGRERGREGDGVRGRKRDG